MQAIELLKQNHYTCVAIKDDIIYHSNLKGIAPLLNPMLENEKYFEGKEVADKVIGKSAAMLLIKSHVKHIHAVILSNHAKNILDTYHVSYTYEHLVPYIVNRTQDGMCPMEQTVLEIEDLDEAFIALVKKREELIKK